eukprot:767038-Hanusia_phi.AAC.1
MMNLRLRTPTLTPCMQSARRRKNACYNTLLASALLAISTSNSDPAAVPRPRPILLPSHQKERRTRRRRRRRRRRKRASSDCLKEPSRPTVAPRHRYPNPSVAQASGHSRPFAIPASGPQASDGAACQALSVGSRRSLRLFQEERAKKQRQHWMLYACCGGKVEKAC